MFPVNQRYESPSFFEQGNTLFSHVATVRHFWALISQRFKSFAIFGRKLFEILKAVLNWVEITITYPRSKSCSAHVSPITPAPTTRTRGDLRRCIKQVLLSIFVKMGENCNNKH